MGEQLNQFIFFCWQSIFLGIIQGVTEFLPISSSAHLKIVSIFLGWGDPGVSISASLQLGSALAVIIYFRNDLIAIIRTIFLRSKSRRIDDSIDNAKLANCIFISNIPILIIGLSIKIFWLNYSNSVLRGLLSIAVVSILMGLLLFLSERYGKRNKEFNDLKTIDILIIGIAQAFALIPGVSRSGATLTAALFMGLDRKTSARISFLIGIPAISISGLVELTTLIHSTSLFNVLPMIVGIVSSFLSSLLAINWFLEFLKCNNTFIFVIYRFAFGVFILSTL